MKTLIDKMREDAASQVETIRQEHARVLQDYALLDAEMMLVVGKIADLAEALGAELPAGGCSPSEEIQALIEHVRANPRTKT